MESPRIQLNFLMMDYMAMEFPAMVFMDDLFGYGGKKFPSTRVRGVVPECRVEVSPVAPAKADYFLHVLTAADSTVNSVPNATARVTDTDVTVTVGKVSATFRKTAVGGRIEIGGAAEKLATKIVVK